MAVRTMRIGNSGVGRFIAAAVVAASVASATPLFAADLDYRDQGPYEDPRYSDIYRHPAPPPPPPRRYAEPYPPPPPPPVYREERFVPPEPVRPPPRRYGYDDRAGNGCTPREAVKDRLESRGWHDFRDPAPMGNVVHIRARRPNGRMFDLTLDRCSGEVLAMEPVDHRAAEIAPPPPPRDWRYEQPRYGRY